MATITREPPRTDQLDPEAAGPALPPADAPTGLSRWGVALAAIGVAVLAAAAAIALVATTDDGVDPPARGEGGGAGIPTRNANLGAARMAPMGSESMPATMHGQTASRPAPTRRTATRRVRVELGEMYVKPSVRAVPAGKVTFVVRNVGKLEHELIVSRIPVMMEAPGMPDHDAGLGMTEHMGPGGSEKLTLRMKPGAYELFCNVPGHYAAGQKLRFRVRPS